MARLAEGRAPCLLGGPWAPALLHTPGNGSLVTRVLPVGTVDEAGWPRSVRAQCCGSQRFQPPCPPALVGAGYPELSGARPWASLVQVLGEEMISNGFPGKREGGEAALRAQCWGTGPKSTCVGAGLAPRRPATLHPVLAGLSRAAGACAHGLMEGGSLHFSQDAAHRAAASVLGGSQQQHEPLRRGICLGMGCWSTFTPAPCLHHPGCRGGAGSSRGAAALSLIEGDFAPWALPAQPLSLQSRAGVCFSCGREAAEWGWVGAETGVKGGGGVAGGQP